MRWITFYAYLALMFTMDDATAAVMTRTMAEVQDVRGVPTNVVEWLCHAEIRVIVKIH